MTTKENILHKLTEAVSGTDKALYTNAEREKFAAFYADKWDDFTSDDVIAESFVDFWHGTDRECRRCTNCGKLMQKGYCVDAGEAYYCCDDCLGTEYTKEEWLKECEENDESYYTEWGMKIKDTKN